jgi:protein phosphatase
LVPAEEMEQVLNDQTLTLQAKADQLVQMALDAGGHDNITVVLVDFAL